ncbi:hypothetical protein GZH47_24895 [Paenibacillus rhizovicinus]|uniref:SLH domain-containing protein n=1 Tax=Paenibacillus rhizovicinus TaxID=2704463 RepID=A0A6C0P590_9BACL|nr:S-layer homology domain-containing protein [Paenibacillus rhizovicinus]QHW33714.1 hypothetical protein GZH47_24895 [Paenibacillus rhizovicinus]
MGKRNKINTILALALGAQLLTPMLAAAEIRLEGTDDPQTFTVMDTNEDYAGSEYRLDIASYDGAAELYSDSSMDPSIPYTIDVSDPGTWIPNFDLDNPHPVTFNIDTVKINTEDANDDEVVDSKTYTWSMVSNIYGSVLAPPELANRLTITITSGTGASVTLRNGDPGVSYADDALAFSYDTTESGPYQIAAQVDGRDYAAMKLYPSYMNRYLRETKIEADDSVHSYFAVEAGKLIPYSVNDRASFKPIDASEDGDEVSFDSNDDAVSTVPLPFDFKFYNETYSDVSISTNGTLSFDNFARRDTHGFQEYPSSIMPPSIYAFTSDLYLHVPDDAGAEPGEDAQAPSHVYTRTVGDEGDRQFIVQWDHVYRYGDEDLAPLTFQAVLYERTGDVRVQYVSTASPAADYTSGSNAVSGIQGNGFNTQNGLLYAMNEPKLTDGLALCYGVSPRCGEAGPVLQSATMTSGSKKITLVFDKALDTRTSLTNQFTLSGSPVTINAAEYDMTDASHKTVILNLSSAPAAGDELRVSYLDNAVRDVAQGIYSEAAADFAVEVNEAPPVVTPPVVTPPTPSGGTDNSGSTTNAAGLPGIAGGGEQAQIATGTVTQTDGRSIMTAVIDSAKLADLLAKAGDKPVITLPVTGSMDRVVAEANGGMMQSLADKSAALTVQTPFGSFPLPVQAFTAKALSALVGSQVQPSDVTIRASITKADEAQLKQMQEAAAKGDFTLLAPPVAFAVTIAYNGQSYAMNDFQSFVKFELPLPAEAEAGQLTTAIALEPNGGFHSVPTAGANRNGSHAAIASSLTGGLFAPVQHAVKLTDVRFHWSRSAVNDLASRMVVNGSGDGQFHPDSSVTRAEFAAILLRALGLQSSASGQAYRDVNSSDWFAGDVAAAAMFGLVSGYEDGNFRPANTVTRQEAMVMIARAMKLAGMETSISDIQAASLLAAYRDFASIGTWAAPSAAILIQNGLVQGGDGQLRPTGQITRAETAVIVVRLLQQAGLIDKQG